MKIYIKRLRRVSVGVGFWAFITMIVISWSTGNAQNPPLEGEKLFKENCAACHTIGKGKLIGPDLKGVAERRDKDWLKRYIIDPNRMFQEKDPVAVALLEEYRVPMPPPALSAQQIDTVIEYLSATEKVEASVPVMLVPTLIAGVAAIVVLTMVGLRWGLKRVEVY